MIRNPYRPQTSRRTQLIPSQIPPPSNIPPIILQQPQEPPQIPTEDPQLRAAQTAWQQLLSRQPASQNATFAPRRPIVLTSENQRENSPWGDALSEKHTDVTRIFSLNANGLSLDKRGGRFEELCQLTKEVQADVTCCQEHNLDTTQSQVRHILYDTTRHHWDRSRLSFSSSPIPAVNQYKPGGTMMMLVNHITGRVHSQSSDHFGRWVSYTLRGRGSRYFTIVSIYQVVTDTPRRGLTTAASQQQSLLIQLQDPITAPRTAFKRDLWTYVHSLVKRGDEILIVGDFNEVFGSHVDGISKLAEDFNLVNLMPTRHSTPLPSTYARGRRCLDYGLASTKFADAMVRCGYDAFNERFGTDHRAFYFDFHTETLFGNDTQVLASPAHRILKSNNVEQVTQYIRAKYEFLASRNAFQRSEQLILPGNRHDFAERLDQDVLQASLAAERTTKKFGAPAWSVALHVARRRVSILKKCLSMSRTGHDISSYIQRDLTRHGIQMLLPQTREDCVHMLRTAKAEVKRLVDESYRRREQERNDRIHALEGSSRRSDKRTAQILRRLRRAEALKQLFDKLKFARTKNARRGITMIEIPCHEGDDPKTCTDWQIIDVPTSIVHHLQQRNRKHFSQAQGTPFTTDPLSSDLGFLGDTPFADDILDGLYDTSHLQEHVRILVNHMRFTYELANLSTFPTITKQEFLDKLKVWKESTTTSPSGLHLGHFKALLARHKYSNEPDETPDSEPHDHVGQTLTEESPPALEDLSAKKRELDHMQQSLIDLHLNLINYALERGYSYRRWQTIANTMLFKDPGSVKIHRTRVIHIYEADFNLFLGLKWRTALYQAEASKQLNDGQYGSRPRRNAIDPVMIEELQFEISRLSRRTFIQTNYDATACYDRIIPNMAMLVSRRFGVAKSVTLANVKTLEHARYHIRTELGLSDTSYSHSDAHPIFGTGQGSGNSPMIWCFISSILFDCYEKEAFAATYCNPDHSNEIDLSMVGFVDDTNGQVNSFLAPESEETLSNIVAKAEFNAAMWTNFLSATGGALELSKCSYHVLHWNFSVNGAPVLINVRSKTEPIKVYNPITQVEELLEYLPPTVAHKTLGHYKDPAGLQYTQFQQLKAKSDTITEFLWETQLTREEAWLYYQACYVPAVVYPLTCSFLSQHQLDTIQRRAMSIIVPKCGFNRRTKREVLYGPIELGGANFRLLSVTQGIHQTMYFLRHWRQESTVGRLLKCALSWLQLSVGVSFSVLDQTTKDLPHMESKWIASLRTFLSTVHASILLDDPVIPPLQRDNDSYIMDHILDSHQFKPYEIRKLNYCRLYLRAVTISDLTLASGISLDPTMLQGDLSIRSASSRWHPIHQDRPSETEWRLWRKANLLWSSSNGTLHQPVQRWLKPIHDQRQQHFAYQQNRRLFLHQIDGQYQLFLQIPETNMFRPRITGVRFYRFRQLPVLSVPVDVIHVQANEDLWMIAGHPHSFTYIPPTIVQATPPSNFAQFIETLQPWEAELLRNVQMSVDQHVLCTHLADGFRVVSDGSAPEVHGNGSFGWVLSSKRGERVIHAMGPSRGRALYSYRAEASGLLSVLRFLIRFREYTHSSVDWPGVLATDAQSVLDTLYGRDRDPQAQDTPVDLDAGRVVLDVLCPEWDLLIEIQASLKHLPQLRLQYVKGHQDKTTSYAKLDLLGQLNVDADEQARIFITEHGQARPFVILSPLTRAHLLLPDGTVTGQYARTLQHEATAKPLLDYIERKHGWTPCTTQDVNWEAHKNALARIPARRTHLIKLLHAMLPTTGLANKFDRGNRVCPRCSTTAEDHDHILRCPHPTRHEWRHDFSRTLDDFLSGCDTHPILHTLLGTAISHWFHSNSDIQVDPNDYAEEVRPLIQQQNLIGWRQIFQGRFATTWSTVQERYYRHKFGPNAKLQKTGSRWQVSIILHVWDKWYTLWKQRNQELHGTDAQTRAEAARRECRRRLSLIYSQRTDYEPNVQALLFEDETEHLQKPTSIIQNWLAANEQLFMDSARRVRNRIRHGVQSILPFLTVRR